MVCLPHDEAGKGLEFRGLGFRGLGLEGLGFRVFHMTNSGTVIILFGAS